MLIQVGPYLRSGGKLLHFLVISAGACVDWPNPVGIQHVQWLKYATYMKIFKKIPHNNKKCDGVRK